MPTVRHAHFSEQGQLARVCSLAFFEDVLFGKLIHPHRKQYPQDCDLYWLRHHFQVKWWDWAHRFLVTTSTDAEGNEVVTGVAHWSRMGSGADKLGLGGWDIRRVAKPLATLITTVTPHIYPNRAADPKWEYCIEQSEHYLDHVWTGPRAESWYLEALAVHPDHQNQGNGRALVQWGLDQAEREGVTASVIAAHGKERFYERCGFDTKVGMAGQGDGNPLRDVPGGTIYFRGIKS